MKELFKPAKLTMIAENIIHTPFLDDEFVESIYFIAKEHQEWGRNKQDIFYSTEDLFFSKFEYLQDLDSLLKERLELDIFPRLLKFWSLDEIIVTELFAVRYTMEGQKKLDLHSDESFISCSIKLNNNYTGGNLFFPLQNFSNESVPPGDLLIWPSRITHPHQSTLLSSGEKYSITVWTEEIQRNKKINLDKHAKTSL
ncbi:MAG: 2OG-Fe(II) oxygenase [bacterium]|jgi:hypothetical protein